MLEEKGWRRQPGYEVGSREDAIRAYEAKRGGRLARGKARVDTPFFAMDAFWLCAECDRNEGAKGN